MVELPIRVLELRSVRGTGGGPEKTILLGTVRTDPSRYAITVCYIRDQRDEIFQIDRRASDLPIDYVEVHEKHSFDRGIWKQLRRILRDRRTDIVHSHDYKTDLLALLLARVEPVIPLATAHGWAGHTKKERWFYYPVDRRLLARFPRVIVVSNEMRQALLRAGARAERIAVVPNGIDHEKFRRDLERGGQARVAFGFAPGSAVIGAVGRLEAEKNYPLLIHAFSSVSREFPNAALVIAGDGSLRTGLDRLIADLGLSERCRLLGHVSDVILLHHALGAFVMCSDNEGSPNAVLEAMALGTPVVATNVGGISDLVRDGREALLVPRGDGTALANALRDVLSRPNAARARAQAARVRVEHELSFETRMRMVEAIYDELLATFPQVRSGQRIRR